MAPVQALGPAHNSQQSRQRDFQKNRQVPAPGAGTPVPGIAPSMMAQQLGMVSASARRTAPVMSLTSGLTMRTLLLVVSLKGPFL